MNPYLVNDLERMEAVMAASCLPGSSLLLTGATGLLGSITVKSIIAYNAEHPEKQITVYAMARSEEKVLSLYRDYFSSVAEAKADGIHFLFQDVRAPIPAEISCDYIIHTANTTTSRTFMEAPVEVMDTIYIGTKQILDFARAAQVKGCVYLSSMEVFGKTDATARLSEKELGAIDLQNVRSCYSEGKRMAECLCHAYAKEYGLPVRVARLAQTFGAGVLPGENRVFAQFARSAVRGEDIVLHTKGNSMGNYCYTTDAIAAILLLLEKGESGDAYTVVNEEMTMRIKEMAALVAAEFSNGKSRVVFDIPEGNSFGYAPETEMRLSGAKLRALGWMPTVGMKEAYTRMLPSLEV